MAEHTHVFVRDVALTRDNLRVECCAFCDVTRETLVPEDISLTYHDASRRTRITQATDQDDQEAT